MSQYERNSCEGCKHLIQNWSDEGGSLHGELVEHCACSEKCENYKFWEAKEGKGLKFDGGKVKWTDAPWYAFQSVVDVMQYGADKYDVNNWKDVDPTRYKDALERHTTSYFTGEDNDQESKMHHLKHIATNSSFLLELDCRKKAYMHRCLPINEELLKMLQEFDDRWLDAKLVYDDNKNLIGVQFPYEIKSEKR